MKDNCKPRIGWIFPEINSGNIIGCICLDNLSLESYVLVEWKMEWYGEIVF